MAPARRGTKSASLALDERLERVSSLHDIESHEWSRARWEESEATLESAEASLSLARGRLIYEQFLRSGPGGFPAPGADGRRALPHFQRAAELFRRRNDARGEAESLFWVGTLEQVLLRDFGAARVALERAKRLTLETGDRLVRSSVERHLGFVAMLSGDPAAARPHLEESVRLRRELEFWPGVVMALIALAEFEDEQHELASARRILDEAEALGREHGTHGALEAVGLARTRFERTAPGGSVRTSAK
jgi:tetratricopeptide (TPR) repeat protein